MIFIGTHMQATINNTLVKNLKVQDKQYDVRDSKLKGFLIRVNPSGKMSYVCEYKRGNRINIGSTEIFTPTQARDRAKEILGDAIKGINPSENKPDHNITLINFMEKHYQPWVEHHRKSSKKTLSRINQCFLSLLGNKKLQEITPLEIEQWRTQRLKSGRSTETVNRDIATFKAALSKAVEWGMLTVNPLGSLKLLKIDSRINVRFLSKDEEIRLRTAIDQREQKIREARATANQWRKERNYNLFDELNPHQFVDHLKPMVLLSLNTGMRQGELFSLTWQNVNFEQSNLTIVGNKAKSGKTRHLPLNTEAKSVLVNWRKQTPETNFVFPSKDGNQLNNVRKSWLRLLKLADIINFRWHDMRHHFASKLVMAGVDLNTVRELLGHSNLLMTLRYAHLAPEHKAKAVEMLVELS